MRNNHGRIQGRAGQKLRARRLANDPLCRMCAEHGLYIKADVIDHIVALANGGTDTDDNCQPLCTKHHEQKTAQDLGYKAKPQTGVDGWPIA